MLTEVSESLGERSKCCTARWDSLRRHDNRSDLVLPLCQEMMARRRSSGALDEAKYCFAGLVSRECCGWPSARNAALFMLPLRKCKRHDAAQLTDVGARIKTQFSSENQRCRVIIFHDERTATARQYGSSCGITTSVKPQWFKRSTTCCRVNRCSRWFPNRSRQSVRIV